MWSLSVRMLVNHFLRWFQVACFSAVLFRITCARLCAENELHVFDCTKKNVG